MAIEIMKKKIEVQVPDKGDKTVAKKPAAKSVVAKTETNKEVMGAKPGETTLPEVKVTGNRPDLNKVTINSDEYKSKKWNYAMKKYGQSPIEINKKTISAFDVYDNYDESEDDMKKNPNAIGKVNVMYSDGTVKKLGEKYTPPYTPLKGGPSGEPEVDYDKLGGRNFYKEYKEYKKNKK